eukprot:TRINITY_DN553_c0_g1_i2.p1 TRINITY_DN553_c0_g1~~TRINITY_DN553_c0_g1_i2.p1  ORF type:complete len:399 (-),score=87.71 TRINITY_DN553_c0_g1_i2:14-1210(-)
MMLMRCVVFILLTCLAIVDGQVTAVISNWRLMSTVTDTAIAFLDTTRTTTIESNSIQNFGFDAVTNPSTVTCVQFFLDSQVWTTREANAPYTVPGDDGGNIPTFNIAAGNHNLTGRVTSQVGDNNNSFGQFGVASTVLLNIVTTAVEYFGTAVLMTSNLANSNIQILPDPVPEDSIVKEIQTLTSPNANANQLTGEFEIRSFTKNNLQFTQVNSQKFTLSTAKAIPLTTTISPPFRVNAGEFVGIKKTGGLPLPVNNPRSTGIVFFANAGNPDAETVDASQQNSAPAWRIAIDTAPAQTTQTPADNVQNTSEASQAIDVILVASVIGGVLGAVILIAALSGIVLLVKKKRGNSCGRCAARKAEVACLECKTNFCSECFAALHKGSWEQHETAVLYKNK